jgi:hypothetical protein
MPVNSRPFTAAARISARAQPKVRRAVAGRAASSAAPNARATPPASVNTCPASASSARLPDTTAPMTWIAKIAAAATSAPSSADRCRPVAVIPWSCCPCPRAFIAAAVRQGAPS